MKKIVLASNNAGKLREFNTLFAKYDIEVVAQNNFNVPDVIEDGLSFVENAIIKARHTAKCTGLPSIADDSGLEIDALNGSPGIYSARFAGENVTDLENTNLVLEKLKNIPDEQRTARFQCLLVYMEHANDVTPLICQGTWEGKILTQAQGENGFGYDPIFYVPTYKCSAAELGSKVKNSLSHRYQALQKLMIHDF
jgi:XTP/dITP diphosphohydrolase